MPNSKRTASSPMANSNKKPFSQLPTSPKVETIISVDLTEINGKEFFGEVTDEEVMYIWRVVFGRTKEELTGVYTSRNLKRQTRINFNCDKPITPEQFHSSPTFTFDRYLDEENTECISGIIVGHGRPQRLQLGKQGTIKYKHSSRWDLNTSLHGSATSVKLPLSTESSKTHWESILT